MAIGTKVLEVIKHLDEGNLTEALSDVCIAVDATAGKVYPHLKKSNSKCYKQWLHDNMKVISMAAFGGVAMENIKFNIVLPDTTPDAQGLVTLEQILYHAIRCKLLHEADIPSQIRVSDEGKTSLENGMLTISAGLISGLLTAVIVSPVNANERCPETARLMFGDQPKPINELWGREDEFIKLFN